MQILAAIAYLGLSIVLGLMSIEPTWAGTSADELKQKIQQRSQNIQEFRNLLNDPNQTVRLAALDTMLKSDDIAMRELAFGVCFSSADQAMRVVCLKNKISDLKTISIKIAEIQNPSDPQKKALANWGGIYVFEIHEYDEKSGQFTSGGPNRHGKGQVTGIGLEFSQNYCNGSFILGDAGFLEGELGCHGSWGGTYPGRIRLQ